MVMVSPDVAPCLGIVSSLGGSFDSDTIMWMSCCAVLSVESDASTVTRYTVFGWPPCSSDGVHSSRPAEVMVGIGVPVTLCDDIANVTSPPASSVASTVCSFDMSSSNAIESTEVNSGGVISITVNCATCESELSCPSETVKLMTCVPTWVGVGVHSNSPVFVSNAVPDMVVPLYEYSSVFVGRSSSWACIATDSFLFVTALISMRRSSVPSPDGVTG